MKISRGFVLGLALALAPLAARASSDPFVGSIAPGGFGVGFALRHNAVPYRDFDRETDYYLIYFYEGERAYLHGSRAGLKFEQGAWRFDAFLQHRYEGFTQESRPPSTLGMALREPGLDAGVSARRRFSWGTPYAELTRDASNNSEGTELRLGYWYDWTRGRFTLRPHASFSLRDAKLNDYYYGVRAGEATPARPAYAPGGGAAGELALHASYRLTDRWQLFGMVGGVLHSRDVRRSPIVDDRLGVAAQVGFLYDFAPGERKLASFDRGAPLVVRALYGFSSDCDVLQIVRLSCTETHTVDNTDIWGVEAGRVFVRRWKGFPVDLGGFVGLLRHREKAFGDDFWQVNGYLKAWFYGFPWDSSVRTRIGFGGGLAYAEQISAMEIRDQARRGRGTWKLLNYMDPTVDVRLGDIIRTPSLKETYVGLGVSHRSGMFGRSQLFGDVNGGSNYIYGYVETSF